MTMADMDSEVKGGGSKAGAIAIATALIGAITTISVAYINRGTPTEQAKPQPGPATPDPQPVPVKDDPAPQPLLQTPRQVAGMWTAQDGEQMEIAQTGSQLTLNGGTMTEAGTVVWQGLGRISDRDIKWTGQFTINGNQLEAECAGRLTTAGNGIQGTCDLLGQKVPFIYRR
jgi:hypothetical protein